MTALSSNYEVHFAAAVFQRGDPFLVPLRSYTVLKIVAN